MKILAQFTRVSPTLLLGALLALGSIALTAPAGAQEAEAKTAIPTTVAAIWSAIDKEAQVLAGLIRAGTLDEVHLHAFAIRDLVRALPERSTALTPEQVRKLKAKVKFVDALATRLDQTGDANDQPGSASNLEKLNGVLASIRSNNGSK